MTDVSVNIFHIALTMKHTHDLKYGSKSTRRRGLPIRASCVCIYICKQTTFMQGITRRRGLNIKDIFFTIRASCVYIYKPRVCKVLLLAVTDKAIKN